MAVTHAPAPRLLPEPVSRRNALRLMLGGAIGLATIEFAATTMNFLWPTLKGGLGAVVDVGALSGFPAVTPQKGEPIHVLKVKKAAAPERP